MALSKPKVAFKVVNKFLESELTPYDQYKLFEERDGRIIAVVKRHDGPLRVFSFPKWAALMDGEAVPLCTDFALAYDSELEFELGVPQHLEISPTTHARFTFTQAPRPLGATSRPQESLLNGVVVRGLNFQPLHILSNTTLLKEAQLFYPVKRLEQFFVDRKSDSVYLELTSNMARAIDMVLKREPHAVAFAQAVLERSRLAIEQIFPDDKTLQIQVQSLESALSIENVWPTAHQNLQIELD